MKLTQRFKADVLVIGAGASGLRAALAAAEAGSQVLVVNKGPVTKSGTTLAAAGGMQAPLYPGDSPEQYFKDTVECGYGLGDQNLVKVLAEEAVARVADLERYGVNFARQASGEYSLRFSPGQTFPRTLSIRGGGVGLVAGLAAACRRHDRITIMDDFLVTGLIKGNSQKSSSIAGAIGINQKTGELTLINAKALVMATGGCPWLWQVNDAPTDANGDGIALAYRAGAELVDMEMVLFYPSVIVWPPSLKGAFVHYEFLASDILDGNIYDNQGNPVLTKPLPIRDQAMRIIAGAINAGRGGPHGGLWWYVGDSPKGRETISKKLNNLQYNYIKAHGVDPATDRIEVAPGAHYLMGGIFIDEDCRASIEGLFAAPECAGNFDGANRMAANGLTATQVFGARAGRSAHKWAVAVGEWPEPEPVSLEIEIARISSRITNAEFEGTSIIELREKLRAAVQRYAGVTRDASGLARLAALAKEIKKSLAYEKVPAISPFNQLLADLLQLENMCEIAELVAGSALLREESRGHHFRGDFPQQDDLNWLKHTMVRLRDNTPEFGTREVIKI